MPNTILAVRFFNNVIIGLFLLLMKKIRQYNIQKAAVGILQSEQLTKMYIYKVLHL
jgi:hypothetical protein